MLCLESLFWFDRLSIYLKMTHSHPAMTLYTGQRISWIWVVINKLSVSWLGGGGGSRKHIILVTVSVYTACTNPPAATEINNGLTYPYRFDQCTLSANAHKKQQKKFSRRRRLRSARKKNVTSSNCGERELQQNKEINAQTV